MSTQFDFHGIELSVEAQGTCAETVLRYLEEDFSYFLGPRNRGAGPSNSVNLQLELHSSGAPKAFKKTHFLFQTRMCRVFGWGSLRICNYFKTTTTVTANKIFGKNSSRHMKAYGDNFSDLYEVTYTLILSVIGEELDKKGLHRIHALGFSYKGQGVLIALPSGGGKSSMATRLIDSESQFKIYSDENPLIRNSQIFSFPQRIALLRPVAESIGWLGRAHRIFSRRIFREKLLFPVPRNQIADASEISVLMLGKLGNSRPEIVPCSRLTAAFGLFVNLVMGVGLAQMVEHMLRWDSIISLPRIAFSRSLEAIRLIRICELYAFKVGLDPKENAAVLFSFLKARPEPLASLTDPQAAVAQNEVLCDL